jgi:hypothetical protein
MSVVLFHALSLYSLSVSPVVGSRNRAVKWLLHRSFRELAPTGEERKHTNALRIQAYILIYKDFLLFSCYGQER